SSDLRRPPSPTFISSILKLPCPPRPTPGNFRFALAHCDCRTGGTSQERRLQSAPALPSATFPRLPNLQFAITHISQSQIGDLKSPMFRLAKRLGKRLNGPKP